MMCVTTQINLTLVTRMVHMSTTTELLTLYDGLDVCSSLDLVDNENGWEMVGSYLVYTGSC